MNDNILMQKGNLRKEVNPADVSRWENFGYSIIDPAQTSNSGKEVAGEASVSPVAPDVKPKKRTTRKKVQSDDKS